MRPSSSSFRVQLTTCRRRAVAPPIASFIKSSDRLPKSIHPVLKQGATNYSTERRRHAKVAKQKHKIKGEVPPQFTMNSKGELYTVNNSLRTLLNYAIREGSFTDLKVIIESQANDPSQQCKQNYTSNKNRDRLTCDAPCVIITVQSSQFSVMSQTGEDANLP